MNVAVFFGGKSCEHDISIITGIQVLNQLKSKYKVIPIYINNCGKWLYSKDFFDINNFKDKKNIKGMPVHIRPSDNNLYNFKNKIINSIEVAIICNHGLNGEDGTLQGSLQLSNIAYSGSNVRASAISMDKITMKDLFSKYEIDILPYVGFLRNEYIDNKATIINRLEDIGYPLIVKPSNLGSSIGINVAKNQEELTVAINVALEFDNRIIVEKALEDFIECNCAVLGASFGQKIASEIEQPTGWKDYLSFSDKYEHGHNTKLKSKNMPANLNDDVRLQMQNIAIKVFEVLSCSGVARVDFLVKDDKIFVNELNAIPGSLSNYLFAYDKFDFCVLLEKLIDIAIAEQKLQQSIKYTFDSSVLSNIDSVKK